jgi:hypothetical protein
LNSDDAQDYEIELEELVRWSKIKEILISSAEKAVIFEDYVNHVLQLEKDDAEDDDSQIEYFPENYDEGSVSSVHSLRCVAVNMDMRYASKYTSAYTN